MWFRDVAHVVYVAVGAYAFTEIGARVGGASVTVESLRLLTLIVLAVVSAIYALAARAETRHAKADATIVVRRSKCDAQFHADVLRRVSNRDPSTDPEDATRVDLLAHLAFVDSGAKVNVNDPTPDLPPLLTTPGRRDAVRDAARNAQRRTSGHEKKHAALPASFHLAEVLDGAVQKSRELQLPGTSPVELAASLEVHTERFALRDVFDAGGRQGQGNSSNSSDPTSHSARFACGGVSMDQRDGVDRVVAICATLVDLTRCEALTELQLDETQRIANSGTPATVRLRMEVGRVGDWSAEQRGMSRDKLVEKKASRISFDRYGGKRRLTEDAKTLQWTEVRLVASLVVPKDAKRQIQRSRRPSMNGRMNKSRNLDDEVSDDDQNNQNSEHSVALSALRRTASAMGGYLATEPATGPDTVGNSFAVHVLLLNLPLNQLNEDEDDLSSSTFLLDPKLPEPFASTLLNAAQRGTNGLSDAFERKVNNIVECVFHPSVSSGRRAHARRLLETYPGVKVTTAKTSAATVTLLQQALRNGAFVVVVCASPTGSSATASARAAVAAVAAHDTLVEATAAAEIPTEESGFRAAAILLAATGADAEAAKKTAKEASVAGISGRSISTSISKWLHTTDELRSDSPSLHDQNSLRFEFSAAPTPATSEEMHAALCSSLKRGCENAVKIAHAAAAARKERREASLLKGQASPSSTLRARRVSTRSDDGDFADLVIEKRKLSEDFVGHQASPLGVSCRNSTSRDSSELSSEHDSSVVPVGDGAKDEASAEATATATAADEPVKAAPVTEPTPELVTELVTEVSTATAPVPAPAPDPTPSTPTQAVFTDPAPSPVKPKPEESKPEESSLEGLRVLVVDDNHFQLRVVKASLKKSGVELDTAVHGKEAVDLVAARIALGGDSKLYDVILMDSMMPVMDGPTATAEIRVLEKAFRAQLRPELTQPGGLHEREMVIIGLSAEAGHEYEQGARAAGMDGALGKPCRPEQLRDALRQVNEGTFSSWKKTSTRGGLMTQG